MLGLVRKMKISKLSNGKIGFKSRRCGFKNAAETARATTEVLTLLQTLVYEFFVENWLIFACSFDAR